MLYNMFKKPEMMDRWKVLKPPTHTSTSLCYSHKRIIVISAVEETQRGHEWHLSISEGGQYPSKQTIQFVRNEFKVKDFEHDDHSKNIASLWQPMNVLNRGECECK